MELQILASNVTILLHSIANGNLGGNKDLLLHILSSIIGYFIVVGSATVAIPQIYNVVKHRSVKGLSVAAFELDVVGYTFILSYSLHKQLPFSAYGEYIFLLSQAVALVALIHCYSKVVELKTWITILVYCIVAPLLIAGHFNSIVYEASYASQHLIFFIARIRQILKNYVDKDTGELSFLTFFINFLRCAARIFTSIEADAPANMIWGFVMSIFLSGTILVQILIYKEPSAADDKKTQ